MNTFEPEPIENRPYYVCPECGTAYDHPEDVARFHFADGEVRIQCFACPIQEDEILIKTTEL